MKKLLMIGLVMMSPLYAFEKEDVIADPALLPLGLEEVIYQKGMDISGQLVPTDEYTVSYIESGMPQNKAMTGKAIPAFIQDIESKGGTIVGIHH